MHGFELYREIRKIDSQVKVCFLTAGEMYYGAYAVYSMKISLFENQ